MGALAYSLWLLYRRPKQPVQSSAAVAMPFQMNRQAQLLAMQRRVSERRSSGQTIGLPGNPSTAGSKATQADENGSGGDFGDDLAVGLAICQKESVSDHQEQPKRRSRKFEALEADVDRLKDIYKQNNSIPK